MTNIPTDLLRTLVAVVDLRSFTKAAAKLGVTQPAVSAQIKRLQFLLNGDLFDRSSPGVSLTPQGELVVSYARRLLSLNDQIVHIGGGGPHPGEVVRVGTPSDYVASTLPDTLAQFRERWPDVRFSVRNDQFDRLARELRSGEIDILVGFSMAPQPDARHSRSEEIVWVKSPATRFETDRPVPLVSYGEDSVYHRLAVAALRTANIDWEDVFTGPSLTSLSKAVAAGFGVMPIARKRAEQIGVIVWEDTPLPKLPDLYSEIYVREGGARAIYEELADDIATVIFGTIHNSQSRSAAARKANSAA